MKTKAVTAEEVAEAIAEANAKLARYRETRLDDHRLTADEKKLLFGLVAKPEEDTARQEFKAATDTSSLLARYGAGQAFPAEGLHGGVVDYTITLQEAIHAVQDAEAAYRRLDPETRKGYRNWRELALATLSADFKAPGAAAGSSAGAQGASPSDSAAGGPPKVP